MLTTNIWAPVVVIFALKYKDNKIPASKMVTIIYSHIVMMELKLIDSLSNDIQYYFKRVFDMKIGYC
jgi:hypothetical protein